MGQGGDERSFSIIFLRFCVLPWALFGGMFLSQTASSQSTSSVSGPSGPPVPSGVRSEGGLLPWESARLACQLADAGRTRGSGCPGAGALQGESQEQVAFGELFRRTLCERPARACELLFRRMGSESPAAVPADSSCEPHPAWIQAQLASSESQTAVAATLRARSGAATTVEAVFRSTEWTDAQRLFEVSRSQMIRTLAAPPFQAPRDVLQKIEAARLFDPRDPSWSAEQRSELLGHCGLKEAGEADPPLGALNAFATIEGSVVICPQMLLSARSPAALGTVIIHELAHLIGPCQTGIHLAGLRSGAGCRIPQEAGSPGAALLAWRRGLLTLERCFHEGGLNRGSTPSWAVRAATVETPELDSETSPLPESCELQASDFRAGSSAEAGLASACDNRPIFMTGMIRTVMEAADSEASTRQKISRAGRVLRLKWRYTRPDSNQFDESFSDYLASRVLPGVLAATPGEASAERRAVDQAFGFSLLCEEDRVHSLRNEVHPGGDDRMAVFASQHESRRTLGCTGQPGRGERLARTLKECPGFR
jgi:hypothetical protein